MAPKQFTENHCAKIPEDKLFNAFKGFKLWTNDYHTGPVSCSMDIWKHLGIELEAHISYYACDIYKLCPHGLKVLPQMKEQWQFYVLDPCPYKIRRDFFNAYKDDPNMQQVDAFFCSHPSSNCELFLPFNRSIILYEHTRLEFGRYDDALDWRKSHVQKYQTFSAHRWREWISTIQKIGSKSNNVIAANNLFDTHYIKYHTGVDAVYIPSGCFAVTENANYNPRGKQMNQLMWGGNRGYPPNFLSQEYANTFRRLGEITNIELTFVPQPKPYNFTDLTAYRAIVVIPYTISTMNYIEFYRLNIPIFFPSKELLMNLIWAHGLVSERIYGHPSHLVNSTISYNPNTNDRLDTIFWMQFADYFQFPHIQYFSSSENLYQQVIDLNHLTHISEQMKTENRKLKPQIYQTWYQVFTTLLDGRRNLEVPQPIPKQYDQALKELWNINSPSDNVCFSK